MCAARAERVREALLRAFVHCTRCDRVWSLLCVTIDQRQDVYHTVPYVIVLGCVEKGCQNARPDDNTTQCRAHVVGDNDDAHHITRWRDNAQAIRFGPTPSYAGRGRCSRSMRFVDNI